MLINEVWGPETNDRFHLDPAARIIRSEIAGPIYLARNAQLGPDVVAGKYTSFNQSTYFAHGTIGSYCAIGARTCLNAQNHPTDWLSTHGFQYHPGAFSFRDEYRHLRRLPQPSCTKARVTIGNDVWVGNTVNIIGNVTIGNGAIIGAGSVVTKDVPPYAVAYGSPATVHRFRFSDGIIERLLLLKWWELELSELDGLPFDNIERCLDMLEARNSRAA